MCIAFSGPPNAKVSFHGTRGAAWVVTHPEYLGWHALSYQNKVSVQGLAPKGHQWAGLNTGRKTGAAMLIVFPLAQGGEYKFLDADGMPKFLTEMTTLKDPRNDYLGGNTRSFHLKGIDHGAVEVRHYGLFDAVVFKNPNIASIQEAINDKVAPSRQPEVDSAAIEFIINAYNPGGDNKFGIALFCYDPYEVLGQGKESLPITILYQTSFPQVLFFSGLDEHNPTKRPNLHSLVDTDHQIAWGFDRTPASITQKVNYSQKAGVLGSIVPDRVAISTHNGMLINGDFVVLLDQLRAGRLEVERWQPPIASIA